MRKVSALIFGFAAILPGAVFAQIGPTTVSDYAFQPVDGDGYIQAWNINVRSAKVFVYVTMIISNVGPGDLNNGVSVLVVKQGASRIWTSEYSGRSLRATPGKFGHRSGLTTIAQDEKGRLVLHTENPGGGASPPEALTMDLVLTPADQGLRISGGLLEPQKGALLRADIPIIASAAEGHITIGGVREDFSGVAGMEAIWTNQSPHTYAKQFLLVRSFSTAPGIFLGGFYGLDEQTFLMRYAVLEKGKIKAGGAVKSTLIQESQQDPFSGYAIPSLVTYTLDNGCTITEQRKFFAGGFDVLGSISAVLRWILRAFFARPYVMHFSAQMTYSCAGAKDIAAEAQASYYLINR